MQDHVDFDEQEAGLSGRPDMIIKLPQGGIVPVDAKVSLEAFLQAMEEDDHDARTECLLRHAQGLRARVRELSHRAYWEQFPTSPEVVVMFVPVEPSLSAAFQHDRDLFEYSFQNKVLVSSPIVLFALLKSIAFGWQQQQVATNAAQIADQGKTVYDRVSTFIGHVTGVGKSLDSSVKRYNEAVASLESRLLPAARRLREMGVATTDIESPEHIETQPRLPMPAGDEEPIR
jgi:DNA recombination protein RmuC